MILGPFVFDPIHKSSVDLRFLYWYFLRADLAICNWDFLYFLWFWKQDENIFGQGRYFRCKVYGFNVLQFTAILQTSANIILTDAAVSRLRHGFAISLWPWWDLPMEIQPSSTFHETIAVPTAVWPLCPTHWKTVQVFQMRQREKLYMRDTFFSEELIMNVFHLPNFLPKIWLTNVISSFRHFRACASWRCIGNGAPPCCQTKETNWNSGPNTLDFPSLSFTMRLDQQNIPVGGTRPKTPENLKGFTVKLWNIFRFEERYCNHGLGRDWTSKKGETISAELILSQGSHNYISVSWRELETHLGLLWYPLRMSLYDSLSLFRN